MNIWIYSFDQIYEHICLTKYIHIFVWLNTNIEYIWNHEHQYPYSNIRYSSINIWISEYIWIFVAHWKLFCLYILFWVQEKASHQTWLELAVQPRLFYFLLSQSWQQQFSMFSVFGLATLHDLVYMLDHVDIIAWLILSPGLRVTLGCPPPHHLPT